MASPASFKLLRWTQRKYNEFGLFLIVFFFLGIINLHKSWTLFSKFTSLLLFYCNFHDLEIQNVPLRLSDHCALLEADKCSLGLLKKKDAFSLFFFDLQKDKYLETVVSIESKGNSSEYPDKFPRDSYPIWSSSFFDLSWMVTIKERKSLCPWQLQGYCLQHSIGHLKTTG